MIELIEKLVEMEIDLSISKLESNIIRVEDFNSINTFEFYIKDLEDRVRIKMVPGGMAAENLLLVSSQEGWIAGLRDIISDFILESLSLQINHTPVDFDLHSESESAWHHFDLSMISTKHQAADLVIRLHGYITQISEGEFEGKMLEVSQTRYERSPKNRKICLDIHGYRCKICTVDFGEMYPGIGKEFIHVHHVKQLSLQSEEVRLDPAKDLIPVCPNCHAMLHRKTPPYLPEELIKIMENT